MCHGQCFWGLYIPHHHETIVHNSVVIAQDIDGTWKWKTRGRVWSPEFLTYERALHDAYGSIKTWEGW
jgi:hypothetical protein